MNSRNHSYESYAGEQLRLTLLLHLNVSSWQDLCGWSRNANESFHIYTMCDAAPCWSFRNMIWRKEVLSYAAWVMAFQTCFAAECFALRGFKFTSVVGARERSPPRDIHLLDVVGCGTENRRSCRELSEAAPELHADVSITSPWHHVLMLRRCNGHVGLMCKHYNIL